MKRLVAMLLAGLLCAGCAGCGPQSESESEEAQAWFDLLDSINERLDQVQEVQEELSSRLDSLAGRLDALESAAQEQPTPAPEAELTPTPEEELSSAIEEPSAVTITSVGQALYDEGGLKITYTGIEVDSLGTNFTFFIENNTKEKYAINGYDTSINGLMMGGGRFSETVSAGKAANTDITVTVSDLVDNGIETIETLEFTLLIYVSDVTGGDVKIPVTITS